jgi:hypothetical protein
MIWAASSAARASSSARATAGSDPIEPLNEEAIQSVDWLNVFDSRELIAVQWYGDPGAAKYGEPEIYRCSRSRSILRRARSTRSSRDRGRPRRSSGSRARPSTGTRRTCTSRASSVPRLEGHAPADAVESRMVGLDLQPRPRRDPRLSNRVRFRERARAGLRAGCRRDQRPRGDPRRERQRDVFKTGWRRFIKRARSSART